MFANYFESQQRIDELAANPESLLLEGFTLRLWEVGYAEITARRHVRAAEHLLYWTHENRIRPTNLSPDIIRRFDSHRRNCTCLRYGHADWEGVMHGVRLFTGYLQDAGVIESSNPNNKPLDPELLVQFRHWMRERRGAKDSTLSTYSIAIRNLLRAADTDPSSFTAHHLREFVLNESAKQGLAATKNCTTALRMFLRFLIGEGKGRAGLDASVPTVANWCLSSLPRYIPADDVEKIIASCDRSTPVGVRDYAIVLLLARLGLRAGDVVRLRLHDIDWKVASMSITNKSGRAITFPLTRDIGQAIVDYIRHARPPSGTDALFVSCRADPASFPRTADHAATNAASKSTGVRNPIEVCRRSRL
ncbi:tyrosine-type recombinase/integrase [Paraburkholderia sp. Ac-20347]|nr:tyrosine-type recombinase/integrase [Paraburkholderia sp. Ac-20347]